MKKKLKICLIVITSCFGFMFNSCEKDFYNETYEENQKPIIKNISLKEIYNLNIDSKLIQTVEQLKQKQKLKSKLVYNSQFDFYIDDEKGILYEKDGIKSYTFQIFRENENDKIENIVFVINQANKIEIFNTKYTLTPIQIEDLSQDKPITLNNLSNNFEINTLSLKNDKEPCYREAIYSEPASTNSQGQVTFSWVSVIRVLIPCPDDVSTGNTNTSGTNSEYNPLGNSSSPFYPNNAGNDTTTSGGGNNSSGNNGGNVNPPIITTPIVTAVSFAEAKLRKTFTDKLNPQQLSFFNLLTNIEKLNFFGFLFVESITPENTDEDGLWNVTSYSSSAISFAKDVINRMIASPGVFKSLTPFIIERKIRIDFALSPCAKNIISKIKDTNQSDFAFIIAKLGDSNSAYTVNINSVPPNQDHLAQTYFVNLNLDNINLDLTTEHLTTGTQLAIATTILHEFVHAYFLSLAADNLMNGTNFPNNLNYLWSQYVYKLSGNINPNIAQHNQIASTYINAIGLALSQFDSNTQPLQFYQDLAWGGLIGTIPFNNLTQEEKDRITANVAAEEKNTSIDINGTVAAPIGVPCN